MNYSTFKNDQGIALFLVLWILTLLTVIVSEFCYSMRTEINITRNFKEQTQAHYIAKAGINFAINELLKIPLTPYKKKEEIEETESDKIIWRINADIPAINFGEGYFKVRIENQSGKININRANAKLLKMMFNQFELDEETVSTIVDSILDWRDKDNLHRLNGAEKDYYQTLENPYAPKNSDFDSLEELLLVKGMTSKIFYGGLKKMLTIWPKSEVKKQKNTSKKDDKKKAKKIDYNKININAASRYMLKMLPQMTDEAADAIWEYRKQEDFKSLSEVSQVAGAEIYAKISPFLSLENRMFFIIHSEGSFADTLIKSKIQALVELNPKLKNNYRIVQWMDTTRRFN